MAISTMGVFLMYDTASAAASASVKGLPSYEQLVEIKDFPNLGGAPEMLETTTLNDVMQTFIPGIQKLDSPEFTANYTLNDYKKLKALEGKQVNYSVWFGGQPGIGGDGKLTPKGDHGKYNFKGALSVYVAGAGVDAVVDMKISIAPSTPITLGAPE